MPKQTEDRERQEREQLEVEEVADGEQLPDRIAMSLITPTGEDPGVPLEPLRGPEEP
jgi:hypothetical protein